MAELGRSFVFVVVLLFTFSLFISITPAEFLGDVDEYDYYTDVPDTWVGDQIAGWDETFGAYNSVIVNKDWDEHDFKVGVHDVQVMWASWEAYEDPLYFRHEIHWTIFYNYHYFKDDPLQESEVQDNIEGYSDPETSKNVMFCSTKDHAYTWYTSITYNSTKFTNLAEAYDGNVSYDPELFIFMGIGWNSTIGTVNAWNVVGQLLSFNTPDVGSTPMNTLIGFSLWTCIIYLAYRLILMAIPFMGGS